MSDALSSTNLYPFLRENGFLGSGVVATERKARPKDAQLVEPSVCALLVPQNVPCKYQLERTEHHTGPAPFWERQNLHQ